VTKIRWKVPHENIHGEASILENFQNKTKSPHFQEGKKKSFEIATFWREKKQVLKSLRFVEDLGRFQAFFFRNAFMKGVLTLTPYPRGGRPDGQTPKILYIVGTGDLRALWSPPVSLNLVHVLVFSRNFYVSYFYVFSVYIIILYNRNKVFIFHFYIFVYLDASLKFGERRHTSFFFK
jgi:hypothetical protein